MKNHWKRCAKNHVIFRHLYRFLPEESDRLNFHAGVNQVTLSLTHDNGYIVDWWISIFHIADPTYVLQVDSVTLYTHHYTP